MIAATGSPIGLKERLRNGDVVLGPWVNLSSPSLIEVAALAGFDFVILDTEHGPLDIPIIEDLCRAADAADIAPIVRVRRSEPSLIVRALDIGAAGVQVPQIRTREDAEAVVDAAKFAPEGARGVSPYTRAARYFADGRQIFERLNREQMVLVHIEGTDGLEQLDEIIRVPGLDVVFLGPYDLSQSLGIPGQVEDDRVVDRMRDAATRIRDAGLAVGTFADEPAAARRWIEAGVQYMSVCVDSGIYLRGCRSLIEAIRE